MIEERLSPRKSVETSGSSLTPRMPFIGPVGGRAERVVELLAVVVGARARR